MRDNVGKQAGDVKIFKVLQCKMCKYATEKDIKNCLDKLAIS